jgi:hypothetical protein
LAHKAIHPNVIQRDDGQVVPIPGQPGGFVAADRHRGRYAGRTMPRRPSAFKPPIGKPALLRQIDDLPPLGPKTATSDEEIRGRLEMLLGVDDSLGRILAALERRGILNDTMVVLTSDHGYFYGEHGLNEERRLAYEETIRIPLIIRYPPLTMAGSTPAEIALSLDIAPTLLEVAGVRPGDGIQGRSLVPVLKNEVPEWRSSFLVEYFTDTVFPRIRNMGYVAVRTARHKYIHYRELQGMDELYDLANDPFEQENLIDRSDAREVLNLMQAELKKLLEQTRFRVRDGRTTGSGVVIRDRLKRKARPGLFERRTADRHTSCPPSTTSTWPVMNSASGEARNRTADAISSGRPSRRINAPSTAFSRIFCGNRAVIGVSTKPGATAFTRIPSRASSVATARVSAMSPPFEAA